MPKQPEVNWSFTPDFFTFQEDFPLQGLTAEEAANLTQDDLQQLVDNLLGYASGALWELVAEAVADWRGSRAREERTRVPLSG
jgi:hypothetical protein